MIKFTAKTLLLLMLMIVTFTVSADDWPSTLYMEQTSFSSTGRVQATGENGVYEFSLTTSSATAGPKYYIFSSADTSTKAKKGTYKIFGASSISDGSNIQPVEGVTYPLVDISSAEDANALVGNQICSFLPLYWAYSTFNITVNLNNMTVVFNKESAPEVTTLGIFNKSVSAPLATADVDANGIARYSLKVSSQTNVYFAANATTRTETNAVPVWGSSSQINPQNVEIAVGNTYALERTTYYQTYSSGTCSFIVPAGSYDIIADTKNGTVEFAEFTGKYRSKPATLYMRSYTFGTSYGTAEGVNGVYTFSFDKPTSVTVDPYYMVFTDVTSYEKAKSSAWVLGSTKEAVNLVPDFGKEYPLVDVDATEVYQNKTGTFMPLYPQEYNIVVDLNNMTISFNPKEELAPLTTLNMMSDAFKIAGTANRDDDGKFRFGYRGAAGDKIFFTTGEVRTDLTSLGHRNYGAGGHANPVNLPVEYNKTYKAEPTSYRRLYTDKTGFFELPGKCDIVFDPETGNLDILPYTGNYNSYPETLYIKLSTFSSTNYGSAKGVDGVYTFEYTTQTYSNAPRCIIFTEATSYTQVNPSTWVLGASEDGSVLITYPGMECKLYDVNAADVKDKNQSYFIPFHPYTYTITVDLKNYTVKWGEAPANPASLKIVDNNWGEYASASADSNGVYNLEMTSYSKHPIFITDATSSSELRSTPWIYFGAPYYHVGNIDITDGSKSDAVRGTYYQYNYAYTGLWNTPEGANRLSARLDTRNNTIEWNVTPVVERDIEVLYVVDNKMNVIGKAISDDSGVYEFDLNLPSYKYIGFSDSPASKGDPGRMFFGSAVPYVGSRITAVDNINYPIYLTSGEALEDNAGTFYLSGGKWHATVDMNRKTVNFKDISRGANWYIPLEIALCDDDLNPIATATVEDGVAVFTEVKISDIKPLTKVVVVDTGEAAGIFGANATGQVGPTVTSGQRYDLYMPTRLWVETDGASCFGLVPSSYNITVDFNTKSIVFVDPSIPIYPDKIQMVGVKQQKNEDGEVIDSEESVLYTASSNGGVYTFSMRNDEEVTFYLTNPSDGKSYGAASINAIVETGKSIDLKEAEEPVLITVPEGLWTVKFNIEELTLSFINTPRLNFISTTLPETETFPSYFGVGRTPEATFTFNNNLKSVSNVYVVLGDYDGGEPVESETLALGLRTARLEDNKLIVGFTGQHYAIPEGAAEKVHIVILKVVDTNNEVLVSTPLAGLPDGSMIFEYPFEEYKRIAIAGKFDIESGSSIDEVEAINVSVNNFDNIKFDNIIFEYPDAEASSAKTSGEDGEDVDVPMIKVPAVWTRGETDDNGYTNVIVNVPMTVRGHNELQFRFDGLDIDDGYDDHADDVTAVYYSQVNPVVIFNSTPGDGETLGKIDLITLRWTHPIIKSVGNMAANAWIDKLGTSKAQRSKLSYSYIYDITDRALVLTPEAPITESGDYLITINQGDLVFNDDITARNKEISILLHVNAILGVDMVVIGDDDNVEVVDLSGIVVRRGKGISTLEGLRGYYIVNGMKCHLGDR